MQYDDNSTSESTAWSPWRSVRLLFGAIAVACVVGFLLGSWLNSTAITGVRVTMLPGAMEPSDHVVLGIGESDKLPDYRLRLRNRDDWQEIGTFVNTSAEEGLDYTVNDAMPLRTIQELQLLEADKIESDVLEQLQITGPDLKGKNYRFQIHTTSSFKAGMEWFFETPIGKAILAGIAIAIVVAVVTKL